MATVLEIKAAVRARDGHRCTECGMTNEEHANRYGKGLHVHRVNPGSAYTLEGCVTLCYSCHGSKPKSDHNTDGHTGSLLPARVDDHLKELLRRVAKKDRRKVGPMVVILLEEAIKARGEWAEPPDAGRQGE